MLVLPNNNMHTIRKKNTQIDWEPIFYDANIKHDQQSS